MYPESLPDALPVQGADAFTNPVPMSVANDNAGIGWLVRSPYDAALVPCVNNSSDHDLRKSASTPARSAATCSATLPSITMVRIAATPVPTTIHRRRAIASTAKIPTNTQASSTPVRPTKNVDAEIMIADTTYAWRLAGRVASRDATSDPNTQPACATDSNAPAELLNPGAPRPVTISMFPDCSTMPLSHSR